MPRTRLAAWFLLVLACTLAPACHREKRRPGTPPRNVLVITTAALRKDHLSSYMYARPTSAWPATEEERKQGRALALDDLAEQGVLFADASSGAPRTFPAACELWTGTRAMVPADPREDRPLESEATTLAERFQVAGFETAAFVAGAPLQEARGLDQGFGLWFAKFSDMAVLERARQWLQEREATPEKPWFVWVHLAGCEPPHDPRGLPTLPGDAPGVLDFARLYSDPKYDGPADGSLDYMKKLASGELVADARDRARLVDLYDGEVARVAVSVRHLVLALRNFDEEGARWNDTLFVFAGLHGVELGDSGPRAWGSDGLSASVVGTPLFIRHPRSLTGSRVLAEPVGTLDVAPTIVNWFGLEALPARAGSLPGRSLLPLVDTYVEKPFERRPMCAVLGGARTERSLRTREFALVEKPGSAGAAASCALYDRIADPAEQHDISASHADVVTRLREELERRTSEGRVP
ncbi:MAG TPA: sulfatase-like hydrolase/transferase [Planctomycetota bacterium]|nr:sulfatase-like hydrolase/transferase [Planctomycetota bacterium]